MLDYLILNGHVIDPANGVDGIKNIAVYNGKITQYEKGKKPNTLSMHKNAMFSPASSIRMRTCLQKALKLVFIRIWPTCRQG